VLGRHVRQLRQLNRTGVVADAARSRSSSNKRCEARVVPGMDSIRPRHTWLKIVVALAFVTGFVALASVVTDLASDEGCDGG
jgi:hypothetical protein